MAAKLGGAPALTLAALALAPLAPGPARRRARRRAPAAGFLAPDLVAPRPRARPRARDRGRAGRRARPAARGGRAGLGALAGARRGRPPPSRRPGRRAGRAPRAASRSASRRRRARPASSAAARPRASARSRRAAARRPPGRAARPGARRAGRGGARPPGPPARPSTPPAPRRRSSSSSRSCSSRPCCCSSPRRWSRRSPGRRCEAAHRYAGRALTSAVREPRRTRSSSTCRRPVITPIASRYGLRLLEVGIRVADRVDELDDRRHREHERAGSCRRRARPRRRSNDAASPSFAVGLSASLGGLRRRTRRPSRPSPRASIDLLRRARRRDRERPARRRRSSTGSARAPRLLPDQADELAERGGRAVVVGRLDDERAAEVGLGRRRARSTPTSPSQE